MWVKCNDGSFVNLDMAEAIGFAKGSDGKWRAVAMAPSGAEWVLSIFSSKEKVIEFIEDLFMEGGLNKRKLR